MGPGAPSGEDPGPRLDVEVVGHDLAPDAPERLLAVLELARKRQCGVLVVLGGDPAVEGAPQ